MIRVIVSGICGRTGSLVAAAVAGDPGLELVGGLETPERAARAAELLAGTGAEVAGTRVESAVESFAPGTFDVLVDFSTPSQSERCGAAARELGKALVVATTGLSEKQVQGLRDAARTCPVVLAPNTSVGANVFFSLLERAASVLSEDFDIEIVEAHHRNKKDAPSGTALRAADLMARARGGSSVVRNGRAGDDAARVRGEIGVHSIRGGSVAGVHTVHFLSELEALRVEHVALSREAFAEGAALAARFAGSAAPGFYDMADVLGLKGGIGAVPDEEDVKR